MINVLHEILMLTRSTNSWCHQ